MADVYDWFQQREIRSLDTTQKQAEYRIARSERGLDDLRDSLDRLTLACAALWSLLKERGMADEELIARIEALDLADGARDGKLAAPPVACPKCRRKTAASRRTCLYCGTALPAPGAFGAGS